LGLIDSHAHLCSEEIWPKIETVVSNAKAAGIERIVNICTDLRCLERGLELVARHPWIGNAAATTPHDVEKEGDFFFPYVDSAASRGDLIAIGETGLDYHYEHSPRAIQQLFLRKYFAIAVRYELPVLIHCRDAFDDLFAIADECYVGRPLLLHCFTGSVSEAKEALKRGWKISFSGIITFKKSEALREAVHFVPLTEMMIETDTPYLAPQSKRGKQNEPSFILETANSIATIKQLSLEEVCTATRKNAMQFFWPNQQ
jgi:TatD DNase family protein